MKTGVRSSSWLLFLWLVASLFVACGGDKKEEAKQPEAAPRLDDAFALLPGSAIVVATVDARAFFSSQTFGADLAKMVEKWMPLGQEAGFLASRDVDRITLGVYSYQGADVAAIVVGRFDTAKIKQVAANQTPTKGGSPLVVSTYAGREVYTVSNVGFSMLAQDRAVVGTESGIRRVLERIQDRRLRRDIAPWMIQTLETPGAAAAVAGDFVSQPAPAELLRQMPMPWLKEARALRAVATFQDPGVQLAGSLTYADEAGAKSAEGGVRQVLHLAHWLSVVGVKIQNVKIAVEKSDVQIQLAVDDQSLRQLLTALPQWTGQ